MNKAVQDDAVQIQFALISHTNNGKTTLARTLTGMDVGEVRDAAHVTVLSESHTLLATPEGDATLVLSRPDGTEAAITPADLAGLPAHVEAGCRIVSTGHPVSGPYTFGGVRLVDLIRAYVDEGTAWRHAA